MQRTLQGAITAAEGPSLSAVVFDRAFEGDSFELRAKLTQRTVPLIEYSAFGAPGAGAEGNLLSRGRKFSS
jgi:hypothetical protein